MLQAENIRLRADSDELRTEVGAQLISRRPETAGHPIGNGRGPAN